MLRFQRVWGLACRACVPLLRMWVVLASGTLGLFEVERIHGGACCYLFMDCRTSAFSPSNYRIRWTVLFSVCLRIPDFLALRSFYIHSLLSNHTLFHTNPTRVVCLGALLRHVHTSTLSCCNRLPPRHGMPWCTAALP